MVWQTQEISRTFLKMENRGKRILLCINEIAAIEEENEKECIVLLNSGEEYRLQLGYDELTGLITTTKQG